MKTEVEIDLTPDQLAEAFVNCGSDKQGRFLNLTGKYFRASGFNAEMQCRGIADYIEKDGRDFIYTVANFLKVRGIPCGSPKEDTLINSYDTKGLT